MQKITILYENHTNPSRPDLEIGHGFAAFIEYDDKKLLFDTGWDGGMLQRNATRLGVDLADLDAIFISHGHWDHMGGLLGALPGVKPLKIYLPSDYSKTQPSEFKRYRPQLQMYRMGGFRVLEEFSEGMASTGTFKLDGPIGEHALALQIGTSSRLLLLVGCLHPGLPAFVESLTSFGEVTVFCGGMHGFQDLTYLENSTFQHLYAGHCTMHFDLLSQVKSCVLHPLMIGTQINLSQL